MLDDVTRRRAERAQWLARRALAMDRHDAGDRATTAALAGLDPTAWRVLGGVVLPGRARTRIDHVVLGPPGLLVVDSRNWSGTITASAGVLRQDGARRERDLGVVREAARDVAAAVSGLGPLPVVPVLCFTPPAMVTGWIDDVLLCATGDVVAVFGSLSPQLLPIEIAELADPVTAVLTPQQVTSPPPAGDGLGATPVGLRGIGPAGGLRDAQAGS